MKRPDYEVAREELSALMVREKIDVEAVFVPFSQSRNAKPSAGADKPWRSLNWRITLKRNSKPVLESDYSAGTGHCPAAKIMGKRGAPNYRTPDCLDHDKAITYEIEKGVEYNFASNASTRKPILPDEVDVFQSLVSDSDVLDYGTFEDWAASVGYDVDSRKAEATYRECLSIALNLRAALGDSTLGKARQRAERM